MWRQSTSSECPVPGRRCKSCSVVSLAAPSSRNPISRAGPRPPGDHVSDVDLSGYHRPRDAEATVVEPDPKRWSILAVVVIAQLMVVLDASIVTIALPSAQRALHISVANRQWVITAYTLAFGGLLLLGGRIADFGGRKRMFGVGLVGFAGGVGPRWTGRRPGHAVRCPGAAGRVRRPDGAGRPLHPDHHLPVRPQRAGQGVRRLRSRVRRRRCHRRARRRGPHRVRLVAVVPAGQRADRPPGRLRRQPGRP